MDYALGVMRVASTYSASCSKCTEIFTRATEAAAVEARDAHERGCKSGWVDDYEPNR